MSDYVRPPENKEETTRFFQELCRVLNALTQGTETTSVTEAAFVENAGGTAVNVDSTFGGYTLQQVVKALQNHGILA